LRRCTLSAALENPPSKDHRRLLAARRADISSWPYLPTRKLTSTQAAGPRQHMYLLRSAYQQRVGPFPSPYSPTWLLAVFSRRVLSTPDHFHLLIPYVTSPYLPIPHTRTRTLHHTRSTSKASQAFQLRIVTKHLPFAYYNHNYLRSPPRDNQIQLSLHPELRHTAFRTCSSCSPSPSSEACASVSSSGASPSLAPTAAEKAAIRSPTTATLPYVRRELLD